MFSAGVMLFMFGYGLAWTGIQRFRGSKVTLLQAMGWQGGEQHKVAGSSGGGVKPSSDTSGGAQILPALGSTGSTTAGSTGGVQNA